MVVLLSRMGGAVEENKINQERDLPVGEVKTRLVTDSQHHSPHDYLASRGVFYSGLECSVLIV